MRLWRRQSEAWGGVVLAMLLCVVCSKGDDRVDEALVGAKTDLLASQKRLSELRSGISQERQELAAQLARREQEVLEKQRQVEVLRLAEDERKRGVRSRMNAALRVREQLQEVQGALLGYRKSCAVRMSDAETAYYAEDFDRLDEALKEKNLSVDMARATLELADRIVRNKRTGLVYQGTVVNDSGRVLRGDLLFIAGYSVFADAQVAGVCLSDAERMIPALFTKTVSRDEQAAIRRLIEGRPAVVPMDVAEGKGLRWAQMDKSIVQQVISGGAVMIPILLTGAAAFLFAVLKGIQLQRLSRQSKALTVDSAVHAAMELQQGMPLPVNTCPPVRIMLETMAEYPSRAHDDFEEILHDRIMSCLPYMEKYLGTLAVLGGAAPLLGLLGTVTGIIHVFRLVTLFGSGDATILSGGISEALVTTESGLVIAIPVLLVHAFFSRQVRSIVGRLESLAVEITHRMDHAVSSTTD